MTDTTITRELKVEWKEEVEVSYSCRFEIEEVREELISRLSYLPVDADNLEYVKEATDDELAEFVVEHNELLDVLLAGAQSDSTEEYYSTNLREVTNGAVVPA